MEASYLTLLCLFVSFVYLCLHFLFYKKQSPEGSSSQVEPPPGKTGWPMVGETIEFVSTGRKGQPEKFVQDRMTKYSKDVFKTHLAGEPTAIFCGAAGNKFLYSNENTLVRAWWPRSVDKILGYTEGSSAEEGANLRRLLPNFIKPEGLHGYVGIMDEIAQKHFAENWDKKEQVVVLPLTKDFTFSLACRLFFSIEDRRRIDELRECFNVLIHGLFAVPVNLPGTHLNKAIKTGNIVRKEIVSIIKQRKEELANGKATPTQDILSHMLSVCCDEKGNFESEHSIAARIIGLLIAGYDAASVTCALILMFLADLPDIYDAVRKEQLEVAASKAPGELLNWEDLQKMKYSWNVACEVMRLAPPGLGGFREAIVDFTYKGFLIPKGWKLHWSVYSTHKNPEFFPDPEKFDPSRFEGYGPVPYTFVPFGGGPRMCPGKEYARLEILVFMHHLVKKYKWEKIIPNERMVVNTSPIPEKGLPVRLFPHRA